MKKPKPIQFSEEELESVRRLEQAAKTYKPQQMWTPEQEEKLRRFYGRVSHRLLMDELKHSWSSITSKAYKLGLKTKSHDQRQGES